MTADLTKALDQLEAIITLSSVPREQMRPETIEAINTIARRAEACLRAALEPTHHDR